MDLPKQRKHARIFNANQKVSLDGKSIRMNDGSTFRRTVLPSALNPARVDMEVADLNAEEFGEVEANKVKEEDQTL